MRSCALAILPPGSPKRTALMALLKLLDMALRSRETASFDTKRTRPPGLTTIYVALDCREWI
jgi:hypothetical protein